LFKWCVFHLQGEETMVPCHNTTRRHIPEDLYLNLHRRENLKSHDAKWLKYSINRTQNKYANRYRMETSEQKHL